ATAGPDLDELERAAGQRVVTPPAAFLPGSPRSANLAATEPARRRGPRVLGSARHQQRPDSTSSAVLRDWVPQAQQLHRPDRCWEPEGRFQPPPPPSNAMRPYRPPARAQTRPRADTLSQVSALPPGSTPNHEPRQASKSVTRISPSV